jgi:hypothetical protein
MGRYLKGVLKGKTFRIYFFPLMFVILLMLVGADNLQLLSRSSNSVIYTYANSFLKGDLGSGYGKAFVGQVSFADLEPGDIVLGGWSNCAYGRYSHAGLYIGNNQVIEGFVDYGLSIQDMSHYYDYSQLCLLRVETTPEIKAKAVAYALAHQGEMFYPLAFKHDERYWNCTKIIWQAYQSQGINLDDINDLWIAPEHLGDSSMVKKLYEKGPSNS